MCILIQDILSRFQNERGAYIRYSIILDRARYCYLCGLDIENFGFTELVDAGVNDMYEGVGSFID